MTTLGNKIWASVIPEDARAVIVICKWGTLEGRRCQCVREPRPKAHLRANAGQGVVFAHLVPNYKHWWL